MIINHNLPGMNAINKMNANSANATKSMQKLSSGLRINTAADDAAGLAISEKMRGQIRGLDQASANAQDGISMVQTAEGALGETESILQRMRELAVQAGNDTNVSVDRSEIQKEMNQLSSEINRIGNTTEFNTQKLLQGDGKSNLDKSGMVTAGTLASGATNNTEASQATTFTALAAGDDGKTATWTLNGQEVTVTFVQDTSLTTDTASVDTSTVTGNSVTVKYNAVTTAGNVGNVLTSALNSSIAKNDVLAQNFSVSNAAGAVTVAATSTGDFKGSAGNIAAVSFSAALATVATGGTASVGTTTYTQASKVIDFASLENTDAATTDANLKALVGTGMTINGQQIEFYNANDGAYTGDAIGVNISTALEEATYTNKADKLAKAIADTVGSKIDGVTITSSTSQVTITDATYKGADGNGKIEVTDGGVQKSFEATFQVGANKGQGFSIEINDMRAAALAVTGSAGADATEGAKFTSTNTVTNGTDSTTREAALDVSSYENATSAVKVINNAIESVSSERSKLGAYQNRLEHTINNLGTSSENLTSAESRIRDVDMAKEMSTFSKNNILSQAAQAMLAQANQQPQQVLQLLR